VTIGGERTPSLGEDWGRKLKGLLRPYILFPTQGQSEISQRRGTSADPSRMTLEKDPATKGKTRKSSCKSSSPNGGEDGTLLISGGQGPYTATPREERADTSGDLKKE